MNKATTKHKTKQIPKGFKQTEIGLIPEDWGISKLVDLANIETGSTPPTNDRSNYGNDFLFVSPADLGNIKWIEKAEKKLSKKGFSMSRFFPKYSILFTCIGSTIGKSGIAKIDLTSNQQINAILPNERYNTDFLYYELQIIAKKIKGQAGEQAVPMINKTSFGEFKVPLPPLKEQKAIAKVLSDTDQLIQKLEQKIAKKKAIKKGAMQTLLKPKEDWVEKKFGDLVKDMIQGVNTAIDIPEYVESGIPMLKANDIIDGKINFNQTDNISNATYASFSKRYKPNKGDFLFSNIGARLGTGSLLKKTIRCSFAWNVMRIVSNLKFIKPDFLSCIINSPSFYSILTSNQTGSGMGFIPKNILKKIKISLPVDLTKQTKIAKILSDMDLEIEQLNEKLKKYQKLKKALMQQLLTGKIRLV